MLPCFVNQQSRTRQRRKSRAIRLFRSSCPLAHSSKLSNVPMFGLVVPPYRYVAPTYLLCLPLLRKLPGVYPKFPNWKTTLGLPPARLPLLSPSTPAAPRPQRTLPARGSRIWKPFSFHQSPRETPATCVRSAGAPWWLHRFVRPIPSAPPQYAGQGRRVPASLGRSEICPACVFPFAAAQTASHIARHRSCRFLSTALSPLAPAICCRSAAPAFVSSRARNALAASTRAPLSHTARIPFRLGAFSQTWRKHRRESVEWLVSRAGTIVDGWKQWVNWRRGTCLSVGGFSPGQTALQELDLAVVVGFVFGDMEPFAMIVPAPFVACSRQPRFVHGCQPLIVTFAEFGECFVARLA